MTEAIRFIIHCYFGDFDDPYLAVIDKAYFDMQTHTLEGDNLFSMRKELTEYFYIQVKEELPKYEGSFDEWHERISKEMKNMSKNTKELSYGQIQKWINMTIKYLYTIRKLGIDGVDGYYADHESEFHAPLDSYVLNAIDVDDTWSTIPSYETYMEYKGKISFNKEYSEWPEYAKEAMLKGDGTYRKAGKSSYKRYIQDNYSDHGQPYCGEIRWQTKKCYKMYRLSRVMPRQRGESG